MGEPTIRAFTRTPTPRSTSPLGMTHHPSVAKLESVYQSQDSGFSRPSTTTSSDKSPHQSLAMSYQIPNSASPSILSIFQLKMPLPATSPRLLLTLSTNNRSILTGSMVHDPSGTSNFPSLSHQHPHAKSRLHLPRRLGSEIILRHLSRAALSLICLTQPQRWTTVTWIRSKLSWMTKNEFS